MSRLVGTVTVITFTKRRFSLLAVVSLSVNLVDSKCVVCSNISLSQCLYIGCAASDFWHSHAFACRYCEDCERYVWKENLHCVKCQTCPTKVCYLFGLKFSPCII